MPTRAALEEMSAARILRTLDFGLMMSIAYTMKREGARSRGGVSRHGNHESAPPPSAFCTQDKRILSAASAASWAGWSPGKTTRVIRHSSTPASTPATSRTSSCKWAYGFAGDVIAFAAPTVVNGTLFVGSAGGHRAGARRKDGLRALGCIKRAVL